MATKAKNVRMTKANIKALTYIANLELKKDEACRVAQHDIKLGIISDIYENKLYDLRSSKWSHAIDMFCDINGLTTSDFFGGNSYQMKKQLMDEA